MKTDFSDTFWLLKTLNVFLVTPEDMRKDITRITE